jgi:hypothetical protein
MDTPMTTRLPARLASARRLAWLAALLSFSVLSGCSGAPLTVTAMINEPLMPVARGEKYGQPLEAFLAGNALGEVVGAGTALGPDGGPDWVEIEVELREGEDGVEALVAKLSELGAPAGSHVYYAIGDDQRRVDIR